MGVSKSQSTAVSDQPETLLAGVTRVCGSATALRLQEAFAGRPVYVPIYPLAENVLSQAVGLENARIISREIGHGTWPPLPLGEFGRKPFKGEIERRLLGGQRITATAREVGCTSRYVAMIAAKLRRAGRLP